MIRLLNSALLVCCGHAPSASANAQTPSRTEATVVARLSLIKSDDLNFGNILVGPSGGTVTVLPDSTSVTTGTVTRVGNTASRATFTGFGRRLQLVQIRIPQTSMSITRDGGTETAIVDNFRIGVGSSLLSVGSLFSIVSSTGIFDVNVGATLRLSANQRPGTYSGSYSLVAVYQ